MTYNFLLFLCAQIVHNTGILRCSISSFVPLTVETSNKYSPHCIDDLGISYRIIISFRSIESHLPSKYSPHDTVSEVQEYQYREVAHKWIFVIDVAP